MDNWLRLMFIHDGIETNVNEDVVYVNYKKMMFKHSIVTVPWILHDGSIWLGSTVFSRLLEYSFPWNGCESKIDPSLYTNFHLLRKELRIFVFDDNNDFIEYDRTDGVERHHLILDKFFLNVDGIQQLIKCSQFEDKNGFTAWVFGVVYPGLEKVHRPRTVLPEICNASTQFHRVERHVVDFLERIFRTGNNSDGETKSPFLRRVEQYVVRTVRQICGDEHQMRRFGEKIEECTRDVHDARVALSAEIQHYVEANTENFDNWRRENDRTLRSLDNRVSMFVEGVVHDFDRMKRRLIEKETSVREDFCWQMRTLRDVEEMERKKMKTEIRQLRRQVEQLSQTMLSTVVTSRRGGDRDEDHDPDDDDKDECFV